MKLYFLVIECINKMYCVKENTLISLSIKSTNCL